MEERITAPFYFQCHCKSLRSNLNLMKNMSTTKPQILLTNDDGIQSPGLWAAAASLSTLGHVTVTAPREQSSGMGRSLPNASDGIIHEQRVQVNGHDWSVFAVGGSPESIVRAGTRGLPVALAIIGGNPDRFSFFADLQRRTLLESGYDPALAPLAVHAHGYVADTTEQAVEEYYNSYAVAMTQLGRERGWGPMNRQQFEMMRGPGGSLVLGDVETVAKKIIRMREILGIDRFMLHISVGTLPHHQVLHSIELLGNEVAPRVESA